VGAQPQPADAHWHAAPVPQKPAGDVWVHSKVQKNEFWVGVDGSFPRSEQIVALLLVAQSSIFVQNVPTPSSLPTSPG